MNRSADYISLTKCFNQRAAAERVFEILDSEDEPGLAEGEKLKTPIKGKVEYINVKFNYGEGNETISDVNQMQHLGRL